MEERSAGDCEGRRRSGSVNAFLETKPGEMTVSILEGTLTVLPMAVWGQFTVLWPAGMLLFPVRWEPHEEQVAVAA